MLETEQEKKSFLYTSACFILLFLLFFYLKFSNETTFSELEGGGGGGDIAVNFGNSDFGSGDNFQSREVVKAAAAPVQPARRVEKEIIVSENDDAPVVADVRKPTEKPKEVVKPIVKPVKPTPSKSTQNALDDLLNGTDKSGDGSDKVGGNKGKADGDTNATGYDGGGGSGTGSGGGNGSGQGIGTGSGYGSGTGSGTGNGNGNYQLGNRKALNKPQPDYICNEQGRVVVEISVDRTGRVVAARAGVKGSTNLASCLLSQAKIAAMDTKWEADAKARDIQIGKIIYNFKLTE
ncbi:MAG TPA: energy transducer TonB [Flavobacterium sp.]|jgi:hypothetical protein